MFYFTYVEYRGHASFFLSNNNEVLSEHGFAYLGENEPHWYSKGIPGHIREEEQISKFIYSQAQDSFNYASFPVSEEELRSLYREINSQKRLNVEKIGDDISSGPQYQLLNMSCKIWVLSILQNAGLKDISKELSNNFINRPGQINLDRAEKDNFFCKEKDFTIEEVVKSLKNAILFLKDISKKSIELSKRDELDNAQLIEELSLEELPTIFRNEEDLKNKILILQEGLEVLRKSKSKIGFDEEWKEIFSEILKDLHNLSNNIELINNSQDLLDKFDEVLESLDETEDLIIDLYDSYDDLTFSSRDLIIRERKDLNKFTEIEKRSLYVNEIVDLYSFSFQEIIKESSRYLMFSSDQEDSNITDILNFNLMLSKHLETLVNIKKLKFKSLEDQEEVLMAIQDIENDIEKQSKNLPLDNSLVFALKKLLNLLFGVFKKDLELSATSSQLILLFQDNQKIKNRLEGEKFHPFEKKVSRKGP